MRLEDRGAQDPNGRPSMARPCCIAANAPLRVRAAMQLRDWLWKIGARWPPWSLRADAARRCGSLLEGFLRVDCLRALSMLLVGRRW